MSRSKLEEYISIIRTLSLEGPLTPDQLRSLETLSAAKTNLSLSFLAKNGMVERISFEKDPAYAATIRGTKVLRYFNVSATQGIVPGETQKPKSAHKRFSSK